MPLRRANKPVCCTNTKQLQDEYQINGKFNEEYICTCNNNICDHGGMNTEEDHQSVFAIFPGHNTKKKWMDRFGYYCHMLYAKLLVQISGPEEQCWDWDCFNETSENIEVAKLKGTQNLNIRGNISMSELSPGIEYEVLYVVKLKKRGSGWELPVKLSLSVPGETVKDRQVNLLGKIREEWIELNVGHFRTRHGETRQINFHLSQRGEHLKKGLVIKGAILRPKHMI